MLRIALFASLAAAPMLPASALAHHTGSVYVDVSGRHHYRAAPAWVPPTGTQIYYGTHITHVPAYPEPNLGHEYPVPVYSGARPLPIVTYGSAHEDWCYSRYRSYRAYDNSFQPYTGGRRECFSPYQ